MRLNKRIVTLSDPGNHKYTRTIKEDDTFLCWNFNLESHIYLSYPNINNTIWTTVTQDLRIQEYFLLLSCVICVANVYGRRSGDLALVLGDCRSHGTPMWWLCWQYFARFFWDRILGHIGKHTVKKNQTNATNAMGDPHVVALLAIFC